MRNALIGIAVLALETTETIAPVAAHAPSAPSIVQSSLQQARWDECDSRCQAQRRAEPQRERLAQHHRSEEERRMQDSHRDARPAYGTDGRN